MATFLSGHKPAVLTTLVLVVAAFIVAYGVFLPGRSVTFTGPRAILDVLLAASLLLVILLFAWGMGRKILRALNLDENGDLESALFSLSVGLGVIAYAVLALGLAGWLEPLPIALLLMFAGLWTWRDWLPLALKAPALWRDWLSGWKGLGADRKVLLGLLTFLLILTLLQALTPPWDYDGLIYHLQGPRLFLEAGRMRMQTDNIWVYYPFASEMLFMLGMGLGSDVFAKLLHLSYAVILVLATYALGRRCLEKFSGLLAMAILVGMPIFPLWASFAYNDITWAAYEFLALYAVFLWLDRQRRSWLVMAGILMGFALGVKYMALGGGAVLGLFVFWKSRAKGWRALLVNGALFGGVALAVGSPWYLKNWLWTGNPVYPFFFTAQEPVAGQVSLWMAYMDGFGAGRRPLDYLLLPVRLYTHYQRFGTFLGSIEIPSFLFPLILFYPWARKSACTNGLLGWVGLRFVVWAVGTHQTRYLLPLFPALSLLSAYVLVGLASKFKKTYLARILVLGLVFGMLATTLVYSALFFVMVRPLGVIVGLESKDAFLRRVIPLYEVTKYLETNLPPEARVMMLWDGRGYYCDERCLPDVTQSQWTYLVSGAQSVDEAASLLRQRNVSHLLYSAQDMNFISQYDVSGQHLQAARFLLQEFIPACTREIYADEYYSLLELICP
ncbi:MAG: glycosyltransferase family 39 protein [Anaerolineales bacterium]|nr:glycosyltransferase family 39 protein [Anaerolineales bacterium]